MHTLPELCFLVRAELDGKLVGAMQVGSIDELLDTVGRWFQLGGDFEGEFSVLVSPSDAGPPAVQVSRNQYLALYFIASTLEKLLQRPFTHAADTLREGSSESRAEREESAA